MIKIITILWKKKFQIFPLKICFIILLVKIKAHSKFKLEMVGLEILLELLTDAYSS